MLPEWDGIIIVSGDGLLHEVGNAFAEHGGILEDVWGGVVPHRWYSFG